MFKFSNGKFWNLCLAKLSVSQWIQALDTRHGKNQDGWGTGAGL